MILTRDIPAPQCTNTLPHFKPIDMNYDSYLFIFFMLLSQNIQTLIRFLYREMGNGNDGQRNRILYFKDLKLLLLLIIEYDDTNSNVIFSKKIEVLC
jgi:hypothetical protein